MVHKEKIEQRLIKLEQTIKKLKAITLYSWDEYRKDEGLKDRVERNLQLVAQACSKQKKDETGYKSLLHLFFEGLCLSMKYNEKLFSKLGSPGVKTFHDKLIGSL